MQHKPSVAFPKIKHFHRAMLAQEHTKGSRGPFRTSVTIPSTRWEHKVSKRSARHGGMHGGTQTNAHTHKIKINKYNLQKGNTGLGTTAHVFNPSSQEIKGSGSLQCPGQPGVHSETPSQTDKTSKRKTSYHSGGSEALAWS